MKQVEEIIYFLEMNSPHDFKPKYLPNPELKVEEAKIPCPELSRFFYLSVGGDWFWMDKRFWNYEQWSKYVTRPNVRTWVGYFSGTPCGYFELEKQLQDIEIVYFGLLRQFINKGLGGWLLTKAVERAWAMEASRVWLHTCTHDHPLAIKNYQERGFKIYKQERSVKNLPERTPGPWDDAGDINNR